MDFGVNFFPAVSPQEKSASDYYDECLRLTELAETLGFEHVQTVEHYFFAYGGYSPDPVAFLTAAAARTRRIRLMTGAALPAFHHPVQLAARLAMLDNLSHGRLDVGFGRAFLPDEFEALGIPMDESRARFNEGVEACRRLWSEENVRWEGQFYRFGPVTLLPRPYQRPHPPTFVASATSTESCAAAGRAGHHLQVVPGVTDREGLRAMLDAYRAGWAEGGRPAEEARIQIKFSCYVSEDRDRALELARTFEGNYFDKMLEAVEAWGRTKSDQYPGYDNFVTMVKSFDFDRYLREHKVLAGTPDDVREQIRTIREWYGTDLSASLQFNAGYMDEQDSTRSMSLFAEHVMPAFPNGSGQ